MLTYLKVGDIYEKNDLLEHGLVSTGAEPKVVGVASDPWPHPGDRVMQRDMVMKPRRWTPEPETSFYALARF